MELRPYYDRPTSVIDTTDANRPKGQSELPSLGIREQGVWPKGEYGKGVLRADQFSILEPSDSGSSLPPVPLVLPTA